MKIWIDGYEANVPQRLGSSQVAFELLKQLEKMDQQNEYIILLPNPPMNDLPKERPGWRYQNLRPNFFKTWIAIPWALYTARYKPDVIFSLSHYAPGFSPVPRVVTIFDLAFLHFPKMFKIKDLWQLRIWTWISIKSAKKIVTISEFSQKDIIKNYDINEKNITVAYPGLDENIFKPIKDNKKIEEIRSKYGTGDTYIIYIGTIQPRKNLVRLIEAMKQVSGVKLVIVGKTTGLGRQAWMFEETLAAPKKFGVEEKVVFTGFVPTEDLPYLLSGAKAFVLPSLWEGFGIPVAEAMACGTAVAVSNVSSLPEVAGEAGVFFDPYQVDDIAKALNTLTKDDKMREKKVQLGLEQARKFSQENFAKAVLAVLEKAAEK